MITNFFLPALENMAIGEVWFQQDGATAHTSRISISVLRENFPGRLISNRGDIPWPARSPDLAPCDYFLWGYLKSKVYNNRPATLEALKKQHSSRDSQHTGCYAGKSPRKLQKSAPTIHRQQW